jgi:protein-S-isoprenylcysteine O-methyltransferase Ste14
MSGLDAPAGFLPQQPPRAAPESIVVRLVATAGVVAIGTAVGAILSATGAEGWVVALVASVVSVILAGLLWRSRRL